MLLFPGHLLAPEEAVREMRKEKVYRYANGKEANASGYLCWLLK